MIDLKFLRENPEVVKQNIKNTFPDHKLPLVDEVIELDAKARAVQQEADDLRASRNKLSKQIGQLMGQGKKDEAEAVKAQVNANAARLAELEEQEEELLKVIEELKDEKGALMPIMQRAQDIYGYLPIEVQKIISDQTGIPLEKIYGVATFYAQFNLSPKGRYQISVCLGTACYVKGSGDIYNKLMEKLGIVGGECTPDGRFSLDACRCIGACGLAPVMTINEEVYGRLKVEDIDDILAKYE